MIYTERLLMLREENNLKIYDVSNLLNLDKDTYGRYERGNDIIPIKHLIFICDYFNVSLDFIFKFCDDCIYNCKFNIVDKINAGIRLKKFRKDMKLTQKDLANISHTVSQVIYKYEKGINLIATSFLYDICKKYNISADYLLGRIDFIPDWCDKKNKKRC